MDNRGNQNGIQKHVHNTWGDEFIHIFMHSYRLKAQHTALEG